MASLAVKTAVEARVATYWTTYTVRKSNQSPEAPVGDIPFLSIQYVTTDTDTVTVGSPGAQVIREEGGIRFVFSVPRTSGLDGWLPIFEAFLLHFRNQKFSGVQTYTPVMPGDPEDANDGKYYLLTSVVPYTADTIG